MIAPPYEDAPLMVMTGVIGVYFLFLGIRAWLADRRGRKHESAAAPCVEQEAWEETVAVRRKR